MDPLAPFSSYVFVLPTPSLVTPATQAKIILFFMLLGDPFNGVCLIIFCEPFYYKNCLGILKLLLLLLLLLLLFIIYY